MDIFRATSRAAICLVRWVSFEVLPLPLSMRSYHLVGLVCRLIGCGVCFGILSLAVQTSSTSHGKLLVALWAGSALTALFIGNIAREWMFGVCTSVATWIGHTFHREGVTLGGRTFLEVHFPAKTWIRYECGADEFSCEGTEPTGRCHRIDVRR